MPQRSTRGSITQPERKSIGRVLLEICSMRTERPVLLPPASRQISASPACSSGSIMRRMPWKSSNSLSLRSRLS